MSTGFALRPDAGRVFLHGELDLATSDEVRRALSGVAPGQVVHVDLRGVTFMDSSAAEVLVELVDAGVTPLLHHAAPIVARVLRILDLDGHLIPDDCSPPRARPPDRATASPPVELRPAERLTAGPPAAGPPRVAG